MANRSQGDQAKTSEARGKRWDAWLIAIVAALIGAAATIVAGLLSNSNATIDVFTGSSPAHAKVTITPSQHPRPTVTVTAAPAPTQPGPVTLPGCPASQGCKGYNLVARPGVGITFATGAVMPNTAGDMDYQRSGDGALEIVPYGGSAVYSTDVTPQQANHQGCEALTTSDATTDPIRGFHQGLTFCVAINTTTGGIALLKETRPLGSDGKLYLRELYWPSGNS